MASKKQTEHVVYIKSSTSSLGIVSVVLGGIAVAICWIPLFGMISIVIAVLAIIVGALGLLFSLLGRSSGGTPLAGIILSIVAIVLCVGINKGIADAIDKANKDIQDKNRGRQVVDK